jgi:hypothetical protein
MSTKEKHPYGYHKKEDKEISAIAIGIPNAVSFYGSKYCHNGV